jgi:hypothetical protein
MKVLLNLAALGIKVGPMGVGAHADRTCLGVDVGAKSHP